MTNEDKFIEVFNHKPDNFQCPIYCSSSEYGECPYRKGFGLCEDGEWWKHEYKKDGSEE